MRLSEQSSVKMDSESDSEQEQEQEKDEFGKEVVFGFGKEVVFGLVEGENRGQIPMPPKKIYDEFYGIRSDNRDSKRVLEIIAKENEMYRNRLIPLDDQVKKIYEELSDRSVDAQDSIPYEYLGYKWFTRSEEGIPYNKYMRTESSVNTEPELVLDVNSLKKEGEEFLSIKNFSINPSDSNFILYLVDNFGKEHYSLYVKNIKENTTTFIIDKISAAEWGPKNIIFFTSANDKDRESKVWMTKNQMKDQNSFEKIYEEQDEQYDVSISRTLTDDFIVITSSSKDTTKHILCSYNPYSSNPTHINMLHFPYKNGVTQHIAHRKGHLNGGGYGGLGPGSIYCVTNEDHCYNGKLLRYDIVIKSGSSYGQYSLEDPVEIISHNPEIYITGIEAFHGFLILSGRENSLSTLWMIEYEQNTRAVKQYSIGNLIRRQIPSLKISDIGLHSSSCYNYDTTSIRVATESFMCPFSIYEIIPDEENFNTALIYEKPVRNYDKSNYTTTLINIIARDSNEIPVYITYKNGTDSSSIHLYGYGAYGSNIDPWFSLRHIPLLDRGIILAHACVRGGSEKGYLWYTEGKLLSKKNTLTDFVDCINYFYPLFGKVSIEGRSAGGLIVGYSINTVPEKISVALGGVPFLDAMNTMCDPSLPLVCQEWSEWGNPNEEKYFDYMLSYSPYDNIKEQEYPHIIFEAGLWDQRVMYWEPLKFIMKVRKMSKKEKTNNSSFLIRINMKAGHFSHSDKFLARMETAEELALLLSLIKPLQKTSSRKEENPRSEGSCGAEVEAVIIKRPRTNRIST